MTTEARFDVLAVDLKTHRVRIFGRDKDAANAEAIVKMAVYRRGVDVEFYPLAAPGLYNDGDTWPKEEGEAV